MHKYIIIGPQGSGKGTQAQKLCDGYDLVHISIGDIFRWNMQHHTKLAARIRRIMNKGLLVPDEIVEEVVRARLNDHLPFCDDLVENGRFQSRELAIRLQRSSDVLVVLVIDDLSVSNSGDLIEWVVRLHCRSPFLRKFSGEASIAGNGIEFVVFRQLRIQERRIATCAGDNLTFREFAT